MLGLCICQLNGDWLKHRFSAFWVLFPFLCVTIAPRWCWRRRIAHAFLCRCFEHSTTERDRMVSEIDAVDSILVKVVAFNAYIHPIDDYLFVNGNINWIHLFINVLIEKIYRTFVCCEGKSVEIFTFSICMIFVLLKVPTVAVSFPTVSTYCTAFLCASKMPIAFPLDLMVVVN